MAADIAKLHGIDPDAVQKLKKQGIETIEDFYEIAKYPDSRKELAEKIDVDPFTLEGWSSAAGNYILMTNCEWQRRFTMCFRPPTAEDGSKICPHCHTLCDPDEEGNCPECGKLMQQVSSPAPATPPRAPSAVSQPSVPGAPKTPDVPRSIKPPTVPSDPYAPQGKQNRR